MNYAFHGPIVFATKGSLMKYEVSSIKNANPSKKFEGIKLQKCLIACKKGINIVVRSSIQKSADIKTQPSTDN